MYDMTKLRVRYFEIKLKNGKILNIEPPKLKVLKKISALSKVNDTENLDEEDINNLIEAVALALSKNKQKFNISTEYVENNCDINEILDLLTNYFNWVNEIQDSKN